MDGTLPPPERPEIGPPKPGGSCLIFVAALFGFVGAVLLTFLMIGYFWPFVIGFAVLSVIALQYLVWGWWFERIYRSDAMDATGTGGQGEREGDG